MSNSDSYSNDWDSGEKTKTLGRMRLNTSSLLRVRCTHCEEPHVVDPQKIDKYGTTMVCGRCRRRFTFSTRASRVLPHAVEVPGRRNRRQQGHGPTDSGEHVPGPPPTGEYRPQRSPRKATGVGPASRSLNKRKKFRGAVSESRAPHMDFTGEFAVARLPEDTVDRAAIPEEPPSTGSTSGRNRTPLGNAPPPPRSRFIRRSQPVEAQQPAQSPAPRAPVRRPLPSNSGFPVPQPAPSRPIAGAEPPEAPATRPCRRDKPYATVEVTINLPPHLQQSQQQG